MGLPACPNPALRAVIFAGLVLGVASSAAAADAEYCVTCTNPDQTYRCKVTGAGKRPSDALKLYCVIRTAKEGNHASCKAADASPACAGLVKVYNYEGPSLPADIAADPRVKGLKERVEQDRRRFEEPKADAKGAAPKTLFELGGRAVDASTKGLRNARSALGGSDNPAADTAAPSTGTAPSTGALPQTGPPPIPPEPAPSVSTADRVKQAAESTGSAVSGFARKSYNCVLSFFRHCSEPVAGEAPQ